MGTTDKKVIAVVGATGQQGGAVVRALRARLEFKVRALTRKGHLQTALPDAQGAPRPRLLLSENAHPVKH